MHVGTMFVRLHTLKERPTRDAFCHVPLDDLVRRLRTTVVVQGCGSARRLRRED